MVEPAVFRMFFFMLLFGVLALAEYLLPRRQLTQKKSMRWLNNLALIFTSRALISLLLPIIAIDVALYTEQTHWGLLNLFTMPFWLTLVLSLLLLDLVIYWQHRLFHQLPWLWRLHRVHHADQDIDLTTGIRFHPIEIILSMLIKCLAVFLLGIPVVPVVIFEIVLNGCALFNHCNLRLPLWFDKGLRQAVVTPDMHRVHHSVDSEEMHRNFGFCLSIWDKIFRSYRAQPKQSHTRMRIGLTHFRTPQDQRLDKMLLQPFRNVNSDD